MEVKVLKIMAGVLEANDDIAARNRKRLDDHGILMVNIMSSPGSGKTSLLMQTVRQLKDEAGLAVIEGDIASQIDADKLHGQGIPTIQINTDGGCHLEASVLEKGLDNLPLDEIDLLFIENVGNLVCPAEFKLGEHHRVMLLSLPEGDDKPYKYPLMFSEADVILLNKTDLQPYLDFDMGRFKQAVSGLNPDVTIFPISCKTGDGLDAWLGWLRRQIEAKRKIR